MVRDLVAQGAHDVMAVGEEADVQRHAAECESNKRMCERSINSRGEFVVWDVCIRALGNSFCMPIQRISALSLSDLASSRDIMGL